MGLLSCSASDAQGPGADAPLERSVAAVDAFIAALASAMCDWQFRCCALPEVDVIGGSAYVTPSDCRPITEIRLRIQLNELRGGVSAHRMAFDSQLAAACVHAFDAGSCAAAVFPEDPWTRLGACRDPFAGQVPSGAPCVLRDECAPGNLCVAGGDGAGGNALHTPEQLSAPPQLRYAATFIGACLPYVTEGKTCHASGDCLPGLYCRQDTFVCARPAAEGEACQGLTNNLPTIVRPCDDVGASLVCQGGACGRLPRQGEPCFDDGVRPGCDPDPSLALVCVGSAFNGAGICETRAVEGASCGGDGLPTCALGLACVGADGVARFGTCGPPPGLGQACGFPSICGPGTVCDADSATCVRGKLLRDGMPCSTGADCASLACLESGPGGGICNVPILDHVACSGEAPAGAVVGADLGGTNAGPPAE